MRRALAALAAATAAFLGAAPGASAGGPTSVLITSPGSGDASALYYSDAEYAQLEELTNGGTAEAEPPALGDSGTHTYRLTWMVHDVTPWRLDEIRFDAPGGPWIATTLLWDELPDGEREPIWRRVSDPKALAQLLDTVMATSSGHARPTPVVTTPTPDAPTATIVEVDGPWFALTGWRWVTPGLLVGAGLGFLVARRRRDADPATRKLLVDREPDLVGQSTP